MRFRTGARGRLAQTERRLACVALAFFVCVAASGVCVFAPASAKTRARQTASRQAAARKAALTDEERAAVGRVTAEDLRAHLKFIASDELEGRDTPSRGLDTAADYIAAQFKRAGLEPAGDDGYFQTATWALKSPALAGSPIKVRNVAGILRGSDPALKDTYVIVSAHYDHLGVREGCDSKKEDCIYNGANDDGSGTVSVIELAHALLTLKTRPKRSILFMTFFGEEKGLLGSRFYGRHPLVPLAKTVAQLNLEQVGRTDDSEGPQVGTVAVTGFDYSDVGKVLKEAGALTGVKVYKHPTNSDRYFSLSDNQALADLGVPAHTLSVAYEYPDYHAVGDEWQKVDYGNMAKVDRAVAAALLLIADDPREPKWDESNPKTARYVEAWKKLHARP